MSTTSPRYCVTYTILGGTPYFVGTGVTPTKTYAVVVRADSPGQAVDKALQAEASVGDHGPVSVTRVTGADIE